MPNYFDFFSIDPSAQLDLDDLAVRYKKLAASKHPDQGGDEQEFNQLNQAYETLKSPALRLRHLVDIENLPYEKQGTVSDDLMTVFLELSPLLQQADSFIKKRGAASSALQKALLEPETISLQEKLSLQIDSLNQKQNALLESTVSVNQYASSARNLAFLEKWHGQLRERFASLF